MGLRVCKNGVNKEASLSHIALRMLIENIAGKEDGVPEPESLCKNLTLPQTHGRML